MKKILILIGLILLLNSNAFAAEAIKASVSAVNVQTFSEKGLFGLKDKNNVVVAKPEYKKLIRLGSQAWIVQKKNKFGLIDNAGNYLIQPKYKHADRFYGSYAKLGNERDYGLYDETGKAIVPPQYTSIDPLFGKMFLTCKDYKYGVVNFEGKVLLKNEFDDIYMPKPTAMRIQYDGQWYEIERMAADEITLPPNVKKITIDNKDFKITKLLADTGVMSGYSILTATDYAMKIFSSISPAYEDTIDELMFSQGAETVTIFLKLAWIPQFPYTYAKKYYKNLRTPNNGPLSDVRNDLKKQLQ